MTALRHAHAKAAAILLLAICLTAPGLQAQQGSLARFAVDLVTLKSGERLRGAFMGRDDNRIVSMAVQRSWLKQNQPKFYEDLIAAEKEAALHAEQDLSNRVQGWIDEEPQQNLMLAFLKGELRDSQDRIESIKADGVDVQFVVVKFPDNKITFKYSQQPDNRKIALLAWREKLKDVETREVADLSKALARDGLEPAQEVVDLSSRLPTTVQSDREWAARRAIVEFNYGEKLEYQGMGKALFRTGGEQKMDLAQVLPQILQSTLTSQLGGLEELLGEPGQNVRPRPAAQNPQADFSGPIADAKQAGVRSFRVTTLDLNPTGGQAAVTGHFVALMPSGEWETIWKETTTEDSSKARPEVENQIKNDPQLKQITDVLKGLGGGLDGQLSTAIRFGGATMEAQKKADQSFFKFRDQYMRRLSGPAISLPTPVQRSSQ